MDLSMYFCHGATLNASINLMIRKIHIFIDRMTHKCKSKDALCLISQSVEAHAVWRQNITSRILTSELRECSDQLAVWLLYP
jgi:hypothetical protein